MPETVVAEPPRLPLLLAAKEALRLIRIVDDNLAEDEQAWWSTIGLLRLAARDLDAAITLHETGLTPQERLREALLIARDDADIGAVETRGARRVLWVVGDALARPRRRREPGAPGRDRIHAP